MREFLARGRGGWGARHRPGASAGSARGWRARVPGLRPGCDGRAHIVRSMSVTIAVLSQKGGTGKTTMVRSLADVFERLGLDVLAIDADPQGNLSDYFDADPEAQPTLTEVLQGQVRAADAVHGPVIPANLTLAEAELMLAGKIGREMTLRSALRDLKREKDVILIDCPPTLGLLTVNALCAATHAILSTEAQYFSLQGMEQAVEVARPRPRQPQPRARAARRVPQHRQHAHPARPADARRASGAVRPEAVPDA